jgi:DNA-binding IclR family transcriptional regulator
MQVVRAIGGRAPLHLTSVGKLFLADDDAVKLKSYVSKTGLNGHTQNSISDLTQLEKELDLVKSLGHARDDEELELGVSCMAAAILDDTGKLVAGLSLSAPTERMQDDWLKSLKDTAMQISKSLGYKPSVKSS